MPSHYEDDDQLRFEPVKTTDVERLLDQTGPEYTRQTIANVKPPPPKEEKPWWHGVALETGVGITADFLTAPLLAAPFPGARPLYYGLNYGIGYHTNKVAQRLRGETEISEGEAKAAGGFQVIPFGTTAKGFKGVRRAMYKGAGAGLVGRQVEVGIDEGRALTPGEAISSAGVGAAFGGTLKGTAEVLPGAIKSTNELRTRLEAQIRGIKSIATGEGLTEVGQGIRTGGGQSILGSFEGTDYTSSTISLTSRNIVGRGAQQRATAATMGQAGVRATRAQFDRFKNWNDRMWAMMSAGDTTTGLKGIDELRDINTDTVQGHHIGPLKQVATALNYLQPEAAVQGARYLARGIGHGLGHDLMNAVPLPTGTRMNFHNRMHQLMNTQLGDPANGLLWRLEERHLGPGRRLSHGVELWERQAIFDDLISVVNDQAEAIDTFWRALSARTDLTRVGQQEYGQSILQIAELDNRLRNVTSGQTATDIINEIIGRQNQKLERLVVLTNRLNLPLDKQNAARRLILLKERGEEALMEVIRRSQLLPEGQVVTSGQVFREYGITAVSKNDQQLIDSLVEELSDADYPPFWTDLVADIDAANEAFGIKKLD